MKNPGEKIKKNLRKLQREALGESNRVPLVPEDYIPLRKIFPPYANFYRHVASSPALENRLEFAASRPVIEGESKDIHQIRCLDAMIGKLTKSFNGSARASEKMLAKIYSHINDVSDSLQRISACNAGGGAKTPVECLDYSKEYSKGNRVIVKIKLGQNAAVALGFQRQ